MAVVSAKPHEVIYLLQQEHEILTKAEEMGKCFWNVGTSLRGGIDMFIDLKQADE